MLQPTHKSHSGIFRVSPRQAVALMQIKSLCVDAPLPQQKVLDACRAVWESYFFFDTVMGLKIIIMYVLMFPLPILKNKVARKEFVNIIWLE